MNLATIISSNWQTTLAHCVSALIKRKSGMIKLCVVSVFSNFVDCSFELVLLSSNFHSHGVKTAG